MENETKSIEVFFNACEGLGCEEEHNEQLTAYYNEYLAEHLQKAFPDAEVSVRKGYLHEVISGLDPQEVRAVIDEIYNNFLDSLNK